MPGLDRDLEGRMARPRQKAGGVESEFHPLKESGKGRTHSKRESIHHTYSSRASSLPDVFWSISGAAFSPICGSETEHGMCFH